MGRTRHIQARMSQRAIDQEMMDLVLKFGISQQDKTILNRQALETLENTIKHLMKTIERLKKKGGLVVIGIADQLLTTYALSSYNRKKKPNLRSVND